MVANINVGLARMNVFFPVDDVRYSAELTKRPRPQFEELITDVAVPFSQQKRDQYPW